jgi:hypothetical protein
VPDTSIRELPANVEPAGGSKGLYTLKPSKPAENPSGD